jgi:hypothetical protein
VVLVVKELKVLLGVLVLKDQQEHKEIKVLQALLEQQVQVVQKVQ